MSISSDQARQQYTLTGSGQTLTVPFKFIAAADLAVMSGANTLVLNSDYTVTGSLPAVGSVIMVAGTAGDVITIYRNAQILQPAVYAPNDAFPAKTTETSLDRAVMQIQQLALKVARALRLPINNAEQSDLPAATWANKMLGFDANGRPTPSDPVGATSLTGTVIQVTSYSALRATSVSGLTTGRQANVSGYSSTGDGGDGLFVYNSSSSATDDNGTILQPGAGSGRWLRAYSGPISVKWFGAKGDGSTDDTLAIQAAINVATGLTSGAYTGNSQTVFAPSGIYAITATLTIGTASGTVAGSSNGLKFVGGGGQIGTATSLAPAVCWIKWTGANAGGPMMRCRNVYGITLEGLNFDGAGLADIGLVLAHQTGDQNPHGILSESCSFQRCQSYNTFIGGTTAALVPSDVANCSFRRCVWHHGSYATRAHIRCTSAEALPVSFYGCEWEGGNVVSYGFELTGGTMNIFGGLMGALDNACFLYNINPLAGLNVIPPNANVYGLEAQGNRAFLKWDYSTSRTTAAGQRITNLCGCYIAGDGTSAQDANAITWDASGWDALVITGTRIARNVNVVGGRVFVSGLIFDDSSGAVTGDTTLVSGQWFDGTAGQTKWRNQTGQGPLELCEAPSSLSRPAAKAFIIFSHVNGGGKVEARIQFPSGADQVIATEP